MKCTPDVGEQPAFGGVLFSQFMSRAANICNAENSIQVSILVFT